MMATIGTGEYKTIPATAERREEIMKRVCDMCGGDIKPPDRFRVNDVTVEIQSGWSYPGEPNIETTEYDICAPCFRDKLVPFIEAAKGNL